MKKRLLSLAMSAVMILGMIPAFTITADAGNYFEPPLAYTPSYAVPVYTSELEDVAFSALTSMTSVTASLYAYLSDGSYYSETAYTTGSVGALFYQTTGTGTQYHIQSRGSNLLWALTTDKAYRDCNNLAFGFDSLYYTAVPSVSTWLEDLDEKQLLVHIGGYFETDATSMSYNGQTVSGRGNYDMIVAFDPDAEIVINGSVSSPYAILIDNTAPTVTNAYFEDLGSGYYENMRLTLEMNEGIRPVNTLYDPDYNNKVDSIDYCFPAGLTITVTYGDINTGVAKGSFEATLAEVDGKYLRFDLPDGVNSKGVADGTTDLIGPLGEFTVISITANQWSLNGSTDSDYMAAYLSHNGYHVFGVQANRLYNSGSTNYTDSKNKPFYLTTAPIESDAYDVWSPYTDYAGNSFSLDGTSLVQYNAVYDKTPPSVESISLAGNMITSTSTSAADKTDWDEDIDLSSLFAGYGDRIALSITFNEDIEIVSDIEISFNFFEKIVEKTDTGSYVTWYEMQSATAYQSNSTTITSTNNWNDAEGAARGVMFYIPYECYPLADAPISVYRITGTVQDKAGNKLVLDQISYSGTDPDTFYWSECTPLQQIYLDTTDPGIDITQQGEVSNSLATFEFDFDDTQYAYTGTQQLYDPHQGSGSIGQILTLGLYTSSTYTSPSTVPFYYYWTNDVDYTPPTADVIKDTWSQSSTYNKSIASTYFYLPITDDIMYLHVYVPEELEIYVPGFYFSGYLTDWAGNTDSIWDASNERTSYFDTRPPVLSVNSVKQSYTTNDATHEIETVTFTANVTAYDEGHGSISWLTGVSVSGGGESASLEFKQWASSSTYTNKDYVITVPASAIKNGEIELTITATDSYGNKATTTRTETVDTSNFTADYTVGGDYSAPTEAPSVIVNGNADGGDTRVTVVAGENTYVRVINSSETDVELFDFDNSWYKVELSNGTYTSVTRLDDTQTEARSALVNYYGPMTFTFDTNANATISLTPVVDASVVPSGSPNHWTGQPFTINYAPVVEDVHSVTFVSMKDAEGNSVTANAAGYYLINQTIEGTTVQFTLANALYADWGVSNIDFTQSYVELISDGKTVATMGLTSGVSQNIALPKYADGTGEVGDEDYTAGALLDSGAYQMKVTIVQKGVATTVDNEDDGIYTTYAAGDTITATMDNYIVYDNVQPTYSGLWGYTTKMSSFGSTTLLTSDISQSQVATGAPYSSVVLNLKDAHSSATDSTWTEVSRDGQMATFYGGADLATLYLGMENATQTVSIGDGDVVIGNASKFRIWNAASSYTSDNTPWIDCNFWDYDDDGDGVVQSRTTSIYLEVNSNFTQVHDNYYSVVNTAAELEDSVKNLLLQGATNTLYYQFEMDNGALSPIYELTVTMTDETPQIAVTMTNPDYVDDSNIDPEGSNEIYSIDITPYEIFSASGDMTFYKLQRGNTNTVTEVVSGETENFSYYDLKDIYSYTLGVPRLTSAYYSRLGYLAMDAYGGVTLITPEFDSSTTDYYFTYAVIDPDNLYISYTDSTYAITSGNYYYQVTTENIPYGTVNLDASSITFDGVALETPLTYSLSETQSPNPVGYIGGFHYSYEDQFGFKIASPYADEIKADTATLTIVFTSGQDPITKTITLKNNSSTTYYSASDKNLYTTFSTNGTGVYTTLVGSFDGLSIDTNLIFPIFEQTVADYEFYDATGALQTVTIDSTGFTSIANMPEAEYSTTEPTLGNVTVTLTLPDGDGGRFRYDSVDYTGSDPCTITMTENGTISVWYWDAGSTFNNPSRYFEYYVTNIVSTTPEKTWIYATNIVQDQETNAYTIDSISDQATVSLSDDNWTLVDAVGDSLSYTFAAGASAGDTYTFKYRAAELPDMDLLEHTVTLPYDVVATVPIEQTDDTTGEVITDSDAPSVQLLAYGQVGGSAFVNTYKLYKDETVGTVEFGDLSFVSTVNPALTDYGDGYTTYTDSTSFVSALGWGSYYRFQVQTSDNSNVQLLIKSAPTIPSYGDTSDEIAGVSLSGTTLDVSANTTFYLYAVDVEGNYTTVPLSFSSVGTAPVPQLAKEVDGSTVRVYLVAANGDSFDNLQITTTGYTTGTGTDEYAGCPYIEFTTNGTYGIDYSHTYMGSTATGTLYVYVNEIDTAAPILTTTAWSASKDSAATNQNVTATLTFNETIATVLGTVEGDTVQVMVSGSTVYVRYYENHAAFTLYFADANGNTMSVDMPAVNNIDTTFNAPASTVMVEDGATAATINFTFGETAIYSQTGASGTSLSFTVTANGDYTYTFYDVAGNSVTATATVYHDNLVPLTLSYNTSNSDTDAVSDASALPVTVETTTSVYVKASRDADVYFNGVKTAVTKDTWTELTLSAATCGSSVNVYAVDTLGNTVTDVLSNITITDTTNPIITLGSSEVTASMSDSEATILTLLKANITATDNVTASSYLVSTTEGLTIAYTKPANADTVIVTYTVKDEKGNTATANCDLTLTADPIITLDGTTISREGTVMVSKDAAKELYIYFDGEPFSLMYEAGLKTVAQVKIGSTDVIYNASTAQTITILDGADTGYYTFCAVTQSHDYFRFIVYVR